MPAHCVLAAEDVVHEVAELWKKVLTSP